MMSTKAVLFMLATVAAVGVLLFTWGHAGPQAQAATGPDTDADGCTDKQELGSNPLTGGGRDALNFFDVADTFTENGLNAGTALTGVVTTGDLVNVINRFGLAGSTLIDPLTDAKGAVYHTRYNRTGVDPFTPDGSIGIVDVSSVFDQFGLDCGGPVPAPAAAAGSMSLNVVAGGVCDDATKPIKCNVLPGAPFTLTVAVNSLPGGSYVGFQTQIVYGPLSYKLTAGENVWPSSGFPMRALNPQSVLHGDASGIALAPSSDTGDIVQIDLNCSPEDQRFKIYLPALSSGNGTGSAFVLADGTEVPPVVVGQTNLDVNGDGVQEPVDLADILLITCGTPVGGIAELAEAAGTPLGAPDSSGSNTGLIAGIVAAIAAGTVTLSGAAWYARRRRV